MGEWTYDTFVYALEHRPTGMSPLRWAAQLANPPAMASTWLLRWTRESAAPSGETGPTNQETE